MGWNDFGVLQLFGSTLNMQIELSKVVGIELIALEQTQK